MMIMDSLLLLVEATSRSSHSLLESVEGGACARAEHSEMLKVWSGSSPKVAEVVVIFDNVGRWYFLKLSPPLSMVAWMPELRAGADTRRLGIVPKFLQLANNFTIYPSTRRGLSLWIWRPLPHNSEIQQMSDSTDECKECSSLGTITIVNCEVSLTVCGERWQNGCPLMLPRSFNFPSARDRELGYIFLWEGWLSG